MQAAISRKKNLCIYLIHKSKQTKLTLLNNNNKKEVANPVFPAFLLLQNVSAHNWSLFTKDPTVFESPASEKLRLPL